jgi:ABC-type phosphate transport system permease subunit
VAGGLSLFGMFAITVMVLPFVASVVTVALLSRPEVRAWFAAPPGGSG